MKAISINNLSYVVGKRDTILKNISFTINNCERVALLGANGSGKTTLLEIILGITKPTGGQILIEEKSSILKYNYGVVWDQVEIFPWLKVKEVINYFSAMRKIKRVDLEICKFLGMQNIMNRLMKTLSKGEKKKVAIAIALMHNPKYVILDELSSDLDEQTLNAIWSNYLNFDKTIIFSTHKWEEAEKYASKFMFLNKGKLILPPMTKDEIQKLYPFHYKIVLGKNTHLELKNDIKYYKLNEQTVILLNEIDNKLIKYISTVTSNYSIIETELVDIYNYLTNIHI